MQRGDGVREALPIAVGALGHDLALLDQALKHLAHVEDDRLAALAAPLGGSGERQVLIVDKNRERMCLL